MNEETKQFKAIFEAHHDPQMQDLKRLLRRKGEKIKEKSEDLGLDLSQKNASV